MIEEKKQSLLIIGQTFPEPSSTAAGGRMMQLISLFQELDCTIIFASTATKTNYSENLNSKKVTTKSIRLNDASFDRFIETLNPTIVLFDRYITEEQFGWRVAEFCPNALRILDTEDLHFLRKAREEAFKNNTEINLFSTTAKREIASILRSDLSLIISEVEVNLLKETFAVPEGLLCYLPFLVESIERKSPSFEDRSHFITIGNFLHAPNVDSVLYLKKELWPLIKKQLPEAVLRIYGAYAPQHILQLNNEKDGFLIKGWAESVETVMQKARVCLAPLRFGAGLKGKLLDAAQYGTPSVSTSIGEEGMFGIALKEDTVSNFVAASVRLYHQKEDWLVQQKMGFEVLDNHFLKELFLKEFIYKIEGLQKRLTQHRKQHFIGQILQYQSFQATKYMSKWIEEKNKK